MSNRLQARDLSDSWLPSFKGVKVLSLDCFDTILWRKVAAPADVFYALANHPDFIAAGLTARLRVASEKTARNRKWVRTGSTEVNLEEIYRTALPNADDALINALANLEVLHEIQHCFVFKPVFELIRQAKKLGMEVIVVSDTYFSQRQLKQLLFSAMPELEGLIDRFFCSNEHGHSKADGIWKFVLPRLKAKPEQVLHLGDNEYADLKSPAQYGMRAVHLVHQLPNVEEILEQRLQVALQLLPDLRHTAPLPSYFHAQLAANQGFEDQASELGYASLGPILYAFADFILADVETLKAEGKNVKLAFLLRDGYLPGLACAALAGTPVGCQLNVSRFTAIAASLNSEEKIVSLLAKMLSRDSIDALARQLLLPQELAKNILARVRKSARPEQEFAQLVRQKDTLRVIMKNSQAFRERLVKHIQRMTGVERGDTLMFVDLGYSATAQTMLQDVLKEDLNVELAGRYLISLDVSAERQERRGLLDATWIDERISIALTGNYIAAFEMMCTQSAPSTVDYSEDGEPVFSQSTVGFEQHATVQKIQAGCLQFIADVRDTPARHKPEIDRHQLAQSAAIDLARMLYFPSAMELACLNNFQFDFNLGTDRKMSLFDLDAALVDMRRQGFGYMNADMDDWRTNYPMELRYLDMSLASLLLSQNRFGFSIKPTQVSYRRESIPALIMRGNAHTQQELWASASYDGYFSLFVSLSNNFHVGLMLGQRYTWIQIDSVQIIEDEALHRASDLTPGEEVIFDQMTYHDNGLFELGSNAMAYLPGLSRYGSGQLCRITFRPIAWRMPS